MNNPLLKQIHQDGLFFVTENWAETVRSAAQLILQDIAGSYGYPPPNVGAFLYQEGGYSSPSRHPLFREVNEELAAGLAA